MNQTKLRIQNILTAIIIIFFLFGSIGLSIYRINKIDYMNYANTTRLELFKDKLELEAGNYPKSKYSYLVVSTSGKVLHESSYFKYKIGETVNLDNVVKLDKNFSYYNKKYVKYTMVLQRYNQCTGFAIYILPKSEVYSSSFQRNLYLCYLPLIIGGILVLTLVLLRTYYCNFRILKPLTQISDSAEAIIAGNYDKEVQRVLDKELNANEVGDLIYSFEMMRDELKSKQEVESSLRKSQQELISCISHDLRTPISTIKAYSEGLRDGIACDTKEQNNFLSIIIKKTNLLEKMIAELLDYSNTQLNQMVIHRKEVYFKSYFEEITRELAVFVMQNDAKLEVKPLEEDFLVCMDEKRITEVLYNLVENSLKYVNKETGRIAIRVEYSNNTPTIFVTDNGSGIQAADIPYVFDKFYRAEKSRNMDVPGSGLGLSICRYIINQHNGEIFCRSRKHCGTEFWFTIGE